MSYPYPFRAQNLKGAKFDEELRCVYTKRDGKHSKISQSTENGYALNTLDDLHLLDREIHVGPCKSCKVGDLEQGLIAAYSAKKSNAIVWLYYYMISVTDKAVPDTEDDFDKELSNLLDKGVPRYIAWNPDALHFVVSIRLRLVRHAQDRHHANALLLRFDRTTKTFGSELYEPHGTVSKLYPKVLSLIEQKLSSYNIPEFTYKGPSYPTGFAYTGGQHIDRLKDLVKFPEQRALEFGKDAVDRQGMCTGFCAMMALIACLYETHDLSMHEIEEDIIAVVVDATKRKAKGSMAVATKGMTRLVERFSLCFASQAVKKLRSSYIYDRRCCAAMMNVEFDMRGKHKTSHDGYFK